ncbi:MAG: hypothetical protein J6P97_03095 [Bacteroidales bacterium]|nr:hypothetical protein [Bacteroidales bacterium]
MKVKFPVQTKEIENGELVKRESEKSFDIDTSLASQIRFETKFPKLAEREDLFGYSKRICAIDELTAPVIISKMKMLYCWFDTDLDFIEFLKLFDLSDEAYVRKLTDAIKVAFELIFSGSAEKNF